MAVVDLYWIPLGAGQSVVRASGRAFETVYGLVHRRRRCELFHSALIVTVPSGQFVIEMTPIADANGMQRGVAFEGPVGTRWLRRFRRFRYEVRCWRDGVIPDASEAVLVVAVSNDVDCAQRLLDLVPQLPAPVWGRDELCAGEMWNSNAVTSCLLAGAGVDTSQLAPPRGGRAPGWDAGLVVATRSRPQRVDQSRT